MLTHLVEPGFLSLPRAIEVLSTAPARLIGATEQGGPLEPGRAAMMRQQLERILAAPGLSRDTFEQVSKSLG